MRDEAWAELGFGKRPRYGGWFQRFRARWRVRLEDLALREMVSVLTAAYVVSGTVPSDFLTIAAEMYSANDGLVKAFGFGSKAEAVASFTESIERYASADRAEWSKILYLQLRPESIPDQQLAARLLLGCAKFGTTAAGMVQLITAMSAGAR